MAKLRSRPISGMILGLQSHKKLLHVTLGSEICSVMEHVIPHFGGMGFGRRIESPSGRAGVSGRSGISNRLR